MALKIATVTPAAASVVTVAADQFVTIRNLGSVPVALGIGSADSQNPALLVASPGQVVATFIAAGESLYAQTDTESGEVLVEYEAEDSGGGSSPSLTVVPVAFGDPIWAGELLLLATLAPGDILLDLWLTVTVQFHKGDATVPLANVYAGVDVANSGTPLLTAPFAFEADANVAEGFAWVPQAPGSNGAVSLSGEAIREPSSKLVPLTAVSTIQIGVFAEDIYALVAGAGSFSLLTVSPT